MPLIIQIIAASLMGGMLSLLAAFLVLFGLPKRWLSYALSFSTGVLLATAMLHLMPEALSTGLTPNEVCPVLLTGVLFFFGLEKFALWHRDYEESAHHPETATLSILFGDGFHNFTDGLLIAAAFLTDPALGWVTTLAVIAHEIPQETGDFAILLAAGWPPKKALIWNTVSSFTSVLGGAIGYFALEQTETWIPYMITLAAASFLYIAIANLLPRLKRMQHGIAWHSLLMLAGIAIASL